MKRAISISLISLVAMLFAATAAFAGAGPETQVAQAPPTAPAPAGDGFSSGSAAGVTVQWKIEGEMINIRISAKTTGWVAVGFDPSRMMRDANIIIGYVSDGQVFLSDDYGTGNTQHGPDVKNGGTNNLSNIQGEEVDGVTTLSFTMPLDSGDSLDKVLAAGEQHKIIVAHGPNGADNFGTYHASRGSFEATL